MTDYFEHEALDRVSLAMNFISDNIYEHPYIVSNPEYHKKIEDVTDILNSIYQEIGNKHFKEVEDY